MKKFRTEQFLYLLAFLLALGLRLLNLGKAPLSDFEAVWPLQSLSLVRSELLDPGAFPGYIFPTTLLFGLFDQTTFVARFLPALAGSLLVLVPYGFRQRLGWKAAILVAFGLALDPGMVALSRLIGGPMMAIAFVGLALALFAAGQFAGGGIFAGLALLSGPSVITGGLGLGFAYGIARLLGFRQDLDTDPSGERTPDSKTPQKADWGKAVLFGGAAILIVATLFFRYPQGLGSWAATISSYLELWMIPSGIPAGRLLAALFFYAILPLSFGLAGAVRGWVQKQSTARFLSIWFLAALFLPLLMPGRQVGDIAWALLPLWALAGLEISRYLVLRDNWLISLGQAALVVVLMIVIWLTLAALDNALPETIRNYWLVMGAAVVIGILVAALVYLGWSWGTARDGLVWGVIIGLSFYQLASVFGVSQVRASSPQEWWAPIPTTKYAALLESTIRDLALAQTGHAEFVDLVSVVDAPSIRWLLRNTTGVRFVSSLDPETTPVMVITRADDFGGLRQDLYRGQDFGWWAYPGWGGALPWEPIHWLTSRTAPVISESVVLWVRLDLFPDEPATAETTDTVENLEEVLPSSDDGVELDD